jgi:hypothetical protein
MATETAVIEELRRKIVQLRDALAEAMDWRWGNDPPPADVIDRLEVVLGLPDEARAVLRQASSVPGERQERLASPVTAPRLPKSAA